MPTPSLSGSFKRVKVSACISYGGMDLKPRFCPAGSDVVFFPAASAHFASKIVSSGSCYCVATSLYLSPKPSALDQLLPCYTGSDRSAILTTVFTLTCCAIPLLVPILVISGSFNFCYHFWSIPRCNYINVWNSHLLQLAGVTPWKRLARLLQFSFSYIKMNISNLKPPDIIIFISLHICFKIF